MNINAIKTEYVETLILVHSFDVFCDDEEKSNNINSTVVFAGFEIRVG